MNRESETGLRVCRIKNKFSFKKEDVVGGYRDLMFCVIYRCPRATHGPTRAGGRVDSGEGARWRGEERNTGEAGYDMRKGVMCGTCFFLVGGVDFVSWGQRGSEIYRFLVKTCSHTDSSVPMTISNFPKDGNVSPLSEDGHAGKER